MKDLDIENSDSVSLIEYAEYVAKYIKYLREQTKSLQKPDVVPVDIRKILQNKLYITLALRSQFSLLIEDVEKEENSFKVWWSKKYNEVRKTSNKHDLPASKWITKSDIEAIIIDENEIEYKKLFAKLNKLKQKKQYLKDLIDDWRSTSYDLSYILKTIEIEGYNT